MGLNVGGLYVRTRGAITAEQVRDAIVRYWTGRGARQCSRAPSEHESLGLESTGQLALGVFPDIDGWIGVYDSERYSCDSDLVEFLSRALETEVVGFEVGEVSDSATMVRFGPPSDDAVQIPDEDAPYWDTIELVEQTFPYPFVYFDQLDDDEESILFVAFEGIGPDEDKVYAGPSEEELAEAAANQARMEALASGDLSAVEALLAEDPEAAGELVSAVEDDLSPESRRALVELALRNTKLELPSMLWLDAYEEAVWNDDARARTLAERFEASTSEDAREHLFWHRRSSFDDLIRAGDHAAMIPKWEATILAKPDDSQSLYSLVMSLRTVRDATSDATLKARYSKRITELGAILEKLDPPNWLAASYRAYALNDCFACELAESDSKADLERALAFSEASLGAFAWNLYHQGTKAEILGKLGRTEEAHQLMHWIEVMHPQLLKDSPPMAAMYGDAYRAWAKNAGEPVSPPDTDVPRGGEPSESFHRDPRALDPELVRALWAVRPGDTEWERARRAALLALVLDPMARREVDGDMAEWLTELQFMQVDLREGHFAGEPLAPETVACMQHWYILSTINPFMAQPGMVYLFGEWRREAASKAWVEQVLKDALQAAGKSLDALDALLMRTTSGQRGPAIVPYGGAAHPMLQKGPIDVWVEMVSAGSGWIEAVRSQLEPGWKALEAWVKSARAKGATITPGAGGARLTLEVDDPRPHLEALQTAIDPAHLVELAFVPRELRDPRAPSSAATLPEEVDPCGYYEPDEMVEIRIPIWDPEVTVRYGIADEVEDLEWEPRATEVARGVLAALSERFGGAPPTLWNKSSEANGPVDRIEREGRQGYGFAIQMNDDAMFRTYPGAVRFREYEMVLAMCDAVKALDLEPVVEWSRFDPYVVNLWERG